MPRRGEDDAAYRAALLDKLVEEAREVRDTSPEERVVELACVLEVLESLLLAKGIDEQEVRRVQRARSDERGGFVRRLRLLEVG